MKIVFLCGSLEFGRDGVGDYTRRLSGELIRQGHQAAIVALYDQHITDEFYGLQNSEGLDLPVLRLPSMWSSKQRFNRAKEWVDHFNPDWISLQFVPFAFQSKGLPLNLGKKLLKLGKGRRWHIMFHELWVVRDISAPKKHILLGNLQRQLIRYLILNLKPAVIHTQTQLYQTRLYKLGFTAKFLPLFSNIPVVGKHCSDIEQASVETSKKITFVNFGSIYPNALIEHFAKEASLYAQEKEIQISLIILGRSGVEQELWVSIWKSAGLTAEVLGEQTPEQISEILKRATVGITTTPYALIEKSGTVAAMREHGLPVLCIAQPWQPLGMTGPNRAPGVSEYQYGNLEECLSERLYYPSSSNKVSEVSRELTNCLLTFGLHQNY